MAMWARIRPAKYCRPVIGEAMSRFKVPRSRSPTITETGPPRQLKKRAAPIRMPGAVNTKAGPRPPISSDLTHPKRSNMERGNKTQRARIRRLLENSRIILMAR
jgi:hypothetical protein